jgi:hypothetical protein
MHGVLANKRKLCDEPVNRILIRVTGEFPRGFMLRVALRFILQEVGIGRSIAVLLVF